MKRGWCTSKVLPDNINCDFLKRKNENNSMKNDDLG